MAIIHFIVDDFLSMNVKRELGVGCYTSRGGGGSEESVINLFVVAFGPVLPTRFPESKS
jgi:hypothetical protein